MAKLPSDADLGGLPSAQSGRPIASYDTTGYARGAAAIGAGIADIGKGIQSAGRDVGHALQYNERETDTLDLAKAESNYLIKTKNLDDQLKNETDPRELRKRYEPEYLKARDESAALITNPRQRELWTLKRNPDVFGRVSSVDDRARSITTDNEIANATTQLETIRQAALKETDPVKKEALIQSGSTLVEGLHRANYITATKAQQITKAWQTNYAKGALELMAPEERINVLREQPRTKDAILDRIGGVESSGNPTAKNPMSSATGLFQFTDGTWLDTVRKHRPDLAGRDRAILLDLRKDPKLSREMAGYLLDDNAAVLRANGVAPDATTLYLAHFLGAGAAAKVANAAPGTPVIDIVGKDAVAANESILRGKTTESVVAWAAQKMGGATRVASADPTAPAQARGLIDFIPVEDRPNLIQHAVNEVKASAVDSKAAIALQEKQAKEASDARELEVFKDIYSDTPTLTARAILDDPTLNKDAKQKLFKLKESATEGDKSEKTYGNGFYEAYRRIHLPDGDPDRITNPSDLYSRVGPKGDLTVAGVDKLVSEIQGRKTPEGVAEGEMKKQFLATAKGLISGTNEGLHIRDPKGDQLYLKFLAEALPAYDKARSEGISAARLLNPDSPDYIGKSIDRFKRPMTEWFSDVIQDAPAAKPAASSDFDVSSIKTLGDLVEAYRAGKVSKSVADEMAIANGWAARRPAAAQVSVPMSR